jgi:type VI secretion system protein
MALLSETIGCAVPQKARLPGTAARKAQRFSIQVNVEDNANQNSPIPADFVMVLDKKLAVEVAKLSAKDWFDRRQQFQRDFATKIKVVSWEWVPGEHTGPITIEVAARTLSAFIFANYLNGGEHRGYIDVRSPVVVNFGPEDFSLQAVR